jgi:carboxyl-terminal processing protease
MRPLVPLLLIISALPAFAADPTVEDAKAMKRLVDALVIMQDNAADPIDIDQAFYGGAVPGLLRHLDPHSSFFDPGQFEQLNQMRAPPARASGLLYRSCRDVWWCCRRCPTRRLPVRE